MIIKKNYNWRNWKFLSINLTILKNIFLRRKMQLKCKTIIGRIGLEVHISFFFFFLFKPKIKIKNILEFLNKNTQVFLKVYGTRNTF